MNTFVVEPQPLKWTNSRVLCAWNNGLMLGGKFPKTRGMLGGNLGDAGWKLYGEISIRPKISEFGRFCKRYILQQQRKQKSDCAINPLGYISTHKVLLWVSANVTTDSKYSIDIKKLKESCKDIYALTFTMDFWCSRRPYVHASTCTANAPHYRPSEEIQRWAGWGCSQWALHIISLYLEKMRRSIVILVSKTISKALPSKWYYSFPQDVPIHHAIDVPIQEHKGWFGTAPATQPPNPHPTPPHETASGSRLSFGTGYSWKRDSSPQKTWDQAAIVKFRHIRAQSRLSRRCLAVNRGFLGIMRTQ